MNIIGITMGCPAGIGPEIIIKYFASLQSTPRYRSVVLGDTTVLEKCSSQLGISHPPLTVWQPGTPIPDNAIPVASISSLQEADIDWGSPNLQTGKAMASYIEKGVELVSEGIIDGITTCPISKTSFNNAGYSFPGHTEMLGSLTNTAGFVMMMAGKSLRITLVTIHCALRDVPELLSIESIYSLITTTHAALHIDFAIPKPRLVVAGLNPHAGEDALFGDEENSVILPAIEKAVNDGINVTGPSPPDTVFYKAVAGAYDAVICMYHDQGLIPFKLLHFEDGVNVTLGLPIVRTSVDHGTAYDIAGQGKANHKSLAEAVHLAAKICDNRNKYAGR